MNDERWWSPRGERRARHLSDAHGRQQRLTPTNRRSRTHVELSQESEVETTWRPLSGRPFSMGSQKSEVQNVRPAWLSEALVEVRRQSADHRRRTYDVKGFQGKRSSGETELVSSSFPSIVRLTGLDTIKDLDHTHRRSFAERFTPGREKKGARARICRERKLVQHSRGRSSRALVRILVQKIERSSGRRGRGRSSGAAEDARPSTRGRSSRGADDARPAGRGRSSRVRTLVQRSSSDFGRSSIIGPLVQNWAAGPELGLSSRIWTLVQR
ncbi:hypothetical protein LR48_Vigan484s000400 [Vigna angularis]|uniref:Uncharacterized protein n=1 Tax=Phaseolus angularis TaxID=3914 RepID=A0A0L9TBU9_PHAAN|nr:hypothetical protein LR48_Vigan484s000400 [Vigna angularis]